MRCVLCSAFSHVPAGHRFMLNVVFALQPSADAERAVSVGGSRTTAVAGGRGPWRFLGIIRVGAASVCPEEVGGLPDFVLFSRARHGSSMESGASEDDFPTETLESCNP